jgi:dihydroorotate dehydrogenase electron transfer subunit
VGSDKIKLMLDEIVAVVENRPLTGGHFLLDLYSPRQARATRPGQFSMVRLLDRSDVILRRPMRIYDVKPSRGGDGAPETVQLLYKIVGRGTRLMAALKPGDRVGLLAPLGHGFLAEEYLSVAENADEVLHVAGGIGIAALLLPARQIAQAGFRQRLFFGARTADDLVGVEDFERYFQDVILATENGRRGHRGYVTQPLKAYLENNPGRKFVVLACGPWAMLQASVELARQYGHPCLVSMENRMGCGRLPGLLHSRRRDRSWRLRAGLYGGPGVSGGTSGLGTRRNPQDLVNEKASAGCEILLDRQDRIDEQVIPCPRMTTLANQARAIPNWA